MNAVVMAPLLLALVVGTCGPGVQAQPIGSSRQADRLTVAVPIDPETLDPAAVATPAAGQVVRLVVETLVAVDQQGRVRPLLATGWDVTTDATAYTFTLRSGVRFSDGEPFDAAAVVVSFDRLLDPRIVRARPGPLTVVQAVRAMDATHVAITLERPYPQLPRALAAIQAAIVAPKSISASRLTPPQLLRLVGTGPFVLKDRVIGRHLTLERNPRYWGSRPGYAEQLFDVVPADAVREAMLTAGHADVTLVPSRDLPTLSKHPELLVIHSGSGAAAVSTTRVRGVYELPDGQLVTAEASPA